MFLNFLSDHIYDKQDWLAAFQTESMLLGILQENWREMIGMPYDELRSSLQQNLEEMSSLKGVRKRLPPQEFWTEFPDREGPYIARMLNDLQLEKEKEVYLPFDAPRALKREQLLACQAESRELRDYLKAKPWKGSELSGG